jgi:hypothetical protein
VSVPIDGKRRLSSPFQRVSRGAAQGAGRNSFLEDVLSTLDAFSFSADAAAGSGAGSGSDAESVDLENVEQQRQNRLNSGHSGSRFDPYVSVSLLRLADQGEGGGGVDSGEDSGEGRAQAGSFAAAMCGMQVAGVTQCNQAVCLEAGDSGVLVWDDLANEAPQNRLLLSTTALTKAEDPTQPQEALCDAHAAASRDGSSSPGAGSEEASQSSDDGDSAATPATRHAGDGLESDPELAPCAVLVQLWDSRTKPIPDLLLGFAVLPLALGSGAPATATPGAAAPRAADDAPRQQRRPSAAGNGAARGGEGETGGEEASRVLLARSREWLTLRGEGEHAGKEFLLEVRLASCARTLTANTCTPPPPPSPGPPCGTHPAPSTPRAHTVPLACYAGKRTWA